MAIQAPLRYGIIGIGAGASNLLDGFGSNPHARIAAAADVRADALEAFGRTYGAETFASAEELCSSPNVDVVWVATPNRFHAEQVILAASHKKHVVVSKPMALTLGECAAMVEAAEKNGVVLMAGHSQGMSAPIRAMSELVRGGELGRLGMVHTWHYTDWWYRPRVPDELDEAQGGGVVYRQAPHQIDIARMIGGGLLRKVQAATLQLSAARPGTGAYTAYLEFESGAPATLVYSGYGHFNTSELTQERGGWWGTLARNVSQGEEVRMKESQRFTGQGANGRNAGAKEIEHPIFGLTLATCERGDVRQSVDGLYVYEDEGRREVALPKTERRGEAELEEMYEAVVHGQPLLHDGRWGMATVEATLAILESARGGRAVDLHHQTALAR